MARSPRRRRPASPTPAFEPGPDGRRYRVTPGTDYDSAFELCAADGAHLAVIDTQEENDHLRMLGQDLWIGFDDLTVEGTFLWVTGSQSAFEQFMGAEPNNAMMREDCATLRADGTWNDTDCDQNHAAICECDPLYQAPPRRACRDEQPFADLLGRRYLLRAAATWPDAAATCEAIGAHLPAISDATENTNVAGLLAEAMWIGYSDAAVEGTFTWVNGAPVGFDAFGGTPLNDAARNCVGIVEAATDPWDVSICTTPRPYACECDPLPP
jgi:hypothetical protein